MNQIDWFLKHYSSFNDDILQPNAYALIDQMNNDIILSPTPPIEPFFQPIEKKNSWGTFLKKSSFNVERKNFKSSGISLRIVKKNSWGIALKEPSFNVDKKNLKSLKIPLRKSSFTVDKKDCVNIIKKPLTEKNNI